MTDRSGVQGLRNSIIGHANTMPANGGVMTSELVPSRPPGSPAPVGADAPIMEVLASMRAMRRLKPDPVPKEVLEQLIAAATWAPSASNAQLYSYIAVTDRAQMARLGALWREVQSKYLSIVTRMDPQTAAEPAMIAVAEASSCYPGAQNLLLAARALGLAANLTVWHLFEEQKFKQALGVPKDVTVYALIPVGWPAGNFGPVRRHPVSEVLHWDRW